jgi:hypothetical protein
MFAVEIGGVGRNLLGPADRAVAPESLHRCSVTAPRVVSPGAWFVGVDVDGV